MPKVLKIDRGVEVGTRQLLTFLLERKKVRGVFAPKRENGAITYSLVTDPRYIKDIVPFYPVMSRNAATSLSRFTWVGPVSEPIAAVLKPCELRAFIELVKRKQGYFDNFFFISSTCGGVYPLRPATNDELNDKFSNYWGAIKKGENVSDIRVSCRVCEHFLPYTSDITVAIVGKEDIDERCEFFLNTDKGEKFVGDMKGEFADEEIETKEVKRLRDERGGQKKKLFEEMKLETLGMKGLIDVFGKCMSCHICRTVCPICYCGLCFFDSPASECKPHTYEVELEKRGALRVPPDTVFFHLGRMAHMSISCVGCGMCTDVCPVNIPISTIFQKVGGAVQELFDYLPGRHVKEKVPVTAFEKEELVEVEN